VPVTNRLYFWSHKAAVAKAVRYETLTFNQSAASRPDPHVRGDADRLRACGLIDNCAQTNVPCARRSETPPSGVLHAGARPDRGQSYSTLLVSEHVSRSGCLRVPIVKSRTSVPCVTVSRVRFRSV
jgi:hypothetical protein